MYLDDDMVNLENVHWLLVAFFGVSVNGCVKNWNTVIFFRKKGQYLTIE